MDKTMEQLQLEKEVLELQIKVLELQKQMGVYDRPISIPYYPPTTDPCPCPIHYPVPYPYYPIISYHLGTSDNFVPPTETWERDPKHNIKEDK